MSTPGPPLGAHTRAATIVMEASNEPGWGMFVWLAVTTDVRGAELCALRWDDVDFDLGALTVRSATGLRRVPLDAQTITLLRAYLAHCAAQAAILGIERHPAAYVFSTTPDGGTAPSPDEFAGRYTRMCAGLGWAADLDRPPHCPTTDLVAAGVDVRVFLWRLQRGLSRIQRRPRA
ncbi:site-specific integrase [Actinosynnema sp. NPDC047251]|nr:site-specific integrase [Saccharothrix espanaensis]